MSKKRQLKDIHNKSSFSHHI